MADINIRSKNIPTVIVLGVDTPIGVAILRDLGKHHYYSIGIGRSSRSIGFASRYCDLPIVRAPSESALIAQLLELAGQFPGAPLIAISESDNLLINRHRANLSKSLRILSAPREQLDNVLDKTRCLKLAESVGIRVPHSFEPTSIEQAQQISNTLTYPRVIKWSDPLDVAQELSDAGLKAIKCEYAFSAKDLVEKLHPYAGLSRLPLVQEYCPGSGLGQMFLVKNGEIQLEFQHQRIHEWPPEGGVSSLCKSVPLSLHRKCREKSAALLKALKWDGVAMVEYRYDSATGTYYFMEINGRFWGSLPLAIAAGVPFASELVGPDPAHATTKKSAGYANLQCRFIIPEVRRIVRLTLQPTKIQDPLFQYSRVGELAKFFLYFFRPNMRYYLFTLRDPGPFLADIRNIIYKMFRKRN